MPSVYLLKGESLFYALNLNFEARFVPGEDAGCISFRKIHGFPPEFPKGAHDTNCCECITDSFGKYLYVQFTL